MPLARRALLPLIGAAVASAMAGAAYGASRFVAIAGRPAPHGTSATRCAQCGSPEHTMLDPRCPRAPRVLT